MADVQIAIIEQGETEVTLAVPGVQGATGATRATGTVAAAGAGTAAAPSISFVANTSTGLFNPAADTLAFAEGGVEAARIDSSGRLLVGTTTAAATGGVLQLSSGITFPATAVAASDANTLDDYEEGTWTPTFNGITTNPTVTYVVQKGRYTKIGNFITVYFTLQISAASGGTGFLIIAGLPFTINTNVSECGGSLAVAQNITGATGFGGLQQSGNNTFTFVTKNNLNNGASYFIPTDLTNNTSCRGTFSYIQA